jgi:putative spermidine/putrescine transport system substrate-binding protein
MDDLNRIKRQLSRRRFLRVGGTLAGMTALGSLAACGDNTATLAPATTVVSTTGAAQTTSAASVGAATTAAGTLPFAGRTLTLFVYSGLTEDTYRKVFAPAFEQATGAKVVLAPGWWDSAAKLKNSPDDQPPYDLVQTDPVQGYPGIRDGLFQKIDLSKIPNAQKFAPPLLDSFVYKESWGLSYISSAMTLVWNKELVPDGLKKWSDLFSEGLKGKIMLYNSYYISLLTFACAKAELDGKGSNGKAEIENNLDAVLQFAKDKRDWVGYWWDTTANGVNALLQKNVSAGNMHGNGMIAPTQDGKPVGFIIPETDKAYYVQLFFVVPRTTKNKDLAEAAINFIASEQIQRDFALKTAQLSVSIPSVAAEVAPKLPVWAKIYPSTEAQFKNLTYYPYDAYDKNSDRIAKFWDREVLRKS